MLRKKKRLKSLLGKNNGKNTLPGGHLGRMGQKRFCQIFDFTKIFAKNICPHSQRLSYTLHNTQCLLSKNRCRKYHETVPLRYRSEKVQVHHKVSLISKTIRERSCTVNKRLSLIFLS